MTDLLSPSPYGYLADLSPAERQAAIARRQHERREDWCDDARRARDYQAECAGFEQACVENADGYESMIADLRARIAELEAALEPFKREAERYDRLVLGEDIDEWKLTTSELTLGDIRRALAALRNR